MFWHGSRESLRGEREVGENNIMRKKWWEEGANFITIRSTFPNYQAEFLLLGDFFGSSFRVQHDWVATALNQELANI